MENILTIHFGNAVKYISDLFSLSGTQEKKVQVPPGKEKADQTGMSILTKMQ
jgi:hypothetical protein